MASNIDDFSRRLATLTDRFAGLATRLAGAARELETSGAPPPDTLLDELATARADLADLRAGILDAARAASVTVPPVADITGLKALDPVLRALREAIAAEEKRRAVGEARRRALTILDRVLSISHRDDANLAALVQCKAKADEIRRVISDPAAFERGDPETIVGSTPAFTALLSLIEARDLDDERFAALEDTVNQSFGRALAVAATRGKLFLVGSEAPAAAPAPPAPAPAAERPAPAPAVSRSAGVPRTLDELAEGLARLAPAAAAPAAAAPAAAPAAPAPAAPAPPAPPPPPPAPPPPAAAPVAPPAVEAPAPAPPEAEGEPARNVDESGRWWVSAWARWTSWKSTLSFADAVKQELGKYSYLLSVPIQRSTDYEEGLLSYGYSILLEYLERQNAGFIAKALNSLKTVAPGGPGQPKTVGAHLYDFLVTEGRLASQYGDFVKSVLVAAVPEPGVWTTARILESTMETRLFTHPSNRIGDTEHNSQRLTQERQRFADHRFTVPLAPLTTRFYAVAADLREPRAVEVKLADGRADIDHAWLLSMPAAGRADLKSELVRLAPEGTSLPGLGKDYATLWVAVFNPDPEAEKRYDLTLGLRKDVRAAAGARPARPA
ncbi:MAG: hypothetical protein A3G44_05255 [Candidatus Rokubacteria bacterium RIFCSPLOWO2_12_FULL_73_47]|nr:MAG: hypothetical protein A3G44_05255 [Candidatus Rokubacteria bacterium RIFCSPLOWO2_12_FULL_73_47]